MSAKTFGDSKSAAYDAATEISFDMVPGRQYRLWCSTDAWFRVVAAGAAGAAAAAVNGDNSHPIAAKTAELVGARGNAQARINVIKAAVAGEATLSEVIASIQTT